ncbi:sulfite exporter TauE/SafE family protein [Pseudomonas sp. CCI3.2]|uniref:sulfite exporter TauE/SafE family protein n=1 Tax=unclassified Pseudomonas TaxID=196821 RepID=UPI002AC8AE23|nr:MULTISPECIES: sulfite exporter TauE/SafE family protein [unclassified Pseudomonas]MEB0078199.1 sulfite exporter TauE/SafE family protein [Pseudomonas sp. MH10out]MEB0093084.1 sulfite exporter TauE/SafE family protein [Pseudomonas sp. CCI4.2]MEB0100039.1 sulfite exporter TauE/SafE family protein [Pseudomonas sp. CCI3.2]MEB0129901.1 sulfite exporter TauE/SafE family protein [Pseudomonas sp. CCI2.4]MEB0157734.1 sulfite exporter TauE/SafE family protein [Pseudomonas sp. AH2 (2023)]
MKTFIEIYQHLGWALSLLVLCVFMIAGVVKGVIGLGLPTVAMGLLGLAMLPAQAAALLIIPATVTNLWQLATGGQLRALIKRLWPMLLLIFLGTGLGTLWLGMGLDQSMSRALGGGLVLYALIGLFLPPLRIAPRFELWLGPLCGLITGFVASATGLFVIPAVPYLQALGLDRNPLVQALGLSFTVSTLALAAGLYWRGALGGGEMGASLLALVPALLGMMLGQWLRHRISAVLFKRVFFIGMGLLGLHLLFN